MAEEVTELGFSVQAKEALTSLRGQYDGSRLPEAAKLAVCALLALPGMKIDVVAKALGTTWETVESIRQNSAGAIREFKTGLAAHIRSALDLSMPSLLEDAKNGKLTVFDRGILVDKLLLLTGEATSVVGHQITGSVGLYSQLNDALRMHSEAGNKSAMDPAAISAPAPIEATFKLVPAPPIGNLPPENTP